MPTLHVSPDSAGLLQDIADCLLKSRKVVVVTGAGISTNSGIPDFRSENGLYSMIQAQFDAAAAKKACTPDQEGDLPSPAATNEDDRPAKRRRLSREGSPCDGVSRASTPQLPRHPDAGNPCQPGPSGTQPAHASTPSRPSSILDASARDALGIDGTELPATDAIITLGSPHVSSTRPREQTGCRTPPSSDDIVYLPSLREPPPPKTARPTTFSGQELSLPGTVAYSSSPLSSPPHVLFDPYEVQRSGSTTSGRSTSESESGDSTPSSQDASSRPPSRNGRTSLPNLKGRDLFDASVWADPLRTSVFYTFATTLRQKVKHVSPTTSHYFISHLRDAGKLVRCYTQNIDEIEEKVGLTTSLALGPGNRGRFSTRLGGRSSLGVSGDTPGLKTESSTEESSRAAEVEAPSKPVKDRNPCNRGVECVFLHGSLHSLRCFMCGQTSDWDEAGREDETMSGNQPMCPRCEGKTAAREERGKRKLGVGKLRPDIVLYGEEHPSAHLISPIVQHDLSLAPDMMLILGTIIKVHVLKVLVKEFAKAVHNKGGKVVFVNYTKPPDSVWSEVIDYWVQWNCDTWVDDLRERKPEIWMPPTAVKLQREKSNQKKRKESLGDEKTETRPTAKRKSTDAEQKPAVPKPEPKRPMSIRDNKDNAAYLVWKMMRALAAYAERTHVPPTARVPAAPTRPESSPIQPPLHSLPVKRKRARQSAPADMQKRRKSNSGEGIDAKPKRAGLPTSRPQTPPERLVPEATPRHDGPPADLPVLPSDNSILAAVKSNPRKRKRKVLDGEEVTLPVSGQRTASAKSKPKAAVAAKSSPAVNIPSSPCQRTERLISLPVPPVDGGARVLDSGILPPPLPPLKPASRRATVLEMTPRIAPIASETEQAWSPAHPRPTPLEPAPDTGPPTGLSPGLGSSPPRPLASRGYHRAFFMADPLVGQLAFPPAWVTDGSPSDQLRREQHETEAAAVLTSLFYLRES